MSSISKFIVKPIAFMSVVGLLLTLTALTPVQAAAASPDYWKFTVSDNQPNCHSGKVVATVVFKGGSQKPVKIALQKSGQIDYKDKARIAVGETKKLKDKAGLAYGETASYAVVAYNKTEPAEPVGGFTVSRPSEADCAKLSQ